MMYSNNGTCHSGRNPYMSLKASDYGLKEPEIDSLRISSLADGTTPPQTPPATSSRASPPAQKAQAVHNVASAEGGPLSSHPVTPVESPDRPILEVPVASDRAESQPSTWKKRPSTSPLDPNSVPDLSLHMPGTQRHHSHSSSAPDDQHKNDTFATRFLRLRSLSTTLRGKNDSKLSLSLSSMGLQRPRSSHSTTLSSAPAAPLARSSTTPLAGTKRPASRGSPQLDDQAGDEDEGASRRTIGRRARKTSAALLASARRASGFWGADDNSSEHKKRQKQSQQHQRDSAAAYRLPELKGVDVDIRADRIFAGAS